MLDYCFLDCSCLYWCNCMHLYEKRHCNCVGLSHSYAAMLVSFVDKL